MYVCFILSTENPNIKCAYQLPCLPSHEFSFVLFHLFVYINTLTSYVCMAVSESIGRVQSNKSKLRFLRC